MMQPAWIAGRSATLDAAIAEAAKLLAASRSPLIAGLGTDVAGARAAILLADRVGAALDHMHSAALLRNLDVTRASGVLITTPGEVRNRADVLFLVGPNVEAIPSAAKISRRVVRLCPGDGRSGSAGAADLVIGKSAKDVPVLLAALRARAAGRPAGKTAVTPKALDEFAGILKAARFGVAMWSAADIDTLSIEMLCGLVNDLNAATRFSTLPIEPSDNAVGVLQTCGWMTGFPMRTGFGRGFPEHDPWLFDGERRIESGEADCVVWVSAYDAATPAWRKPPVTIALASGGARFRTPPQVQIEIGRPGRDHAAVETFAGGRVLAAVEASAPSDALSAADVLTRIAGALPEGGR